MAEKFDHWAIVEVMGHQTYAGRVSEQTIGGTSFVRVDVPQTERGPEFTKLFGSGAIYAMTIVSEDVARLRAASLGLKPLSVYDLPDAVRRAMSVPALPAPLEPSPPPHCYSDDEF